MSTRSSSKSSSSAITVALPAVTEPKGVKKGDLTNLRLLHGHNRAEKQALHDARPLKQKFKVWIANQTFYDMTNQEAADAAGVSKNRWSEVRRHPESKAMIEYVQSNYSNPEAIMSVLRRDSILHAWERYTAAPELLWQKNDIAGAAKIYEKILDSTGQFQRDKSNVNVNVEGSSIRISLNREVKDIDDLLRSPADTAIQEADYEPYYEVIGSSTTT